MAPGHPPHATTTVRDTMRSPGETLDRSTLTRLKRLGHDFSRVRIHTDAQAGQSAREIGARAYTLGHHIAFGHGEYRPHSERGWKLLTHELGHIRQQVASAEEVSVDGLRVGRADDPLELAADQFAASASRGGSPLRGAMSVDRERTVRRAPPDGLDAGVPAPSSAACGPVSQVAVDDPNYPLQVGCMAEAVCPQRVAGGIPSCDAVGQQTNAACRSGSGYADQSPDIWPSDLECAQEKSGVILNPDRVKLLTTLLVEEKGRRDAGKLLSKEQTEMLDSIDLAVKALTRAGLSVDPIKTILTKPSDPKLIAGLSDANTAYAYAIGFLSTETPTVIGVGGGLTGAATGTEIAVTGAAGTEIAAGGVGAAGATGAAAIALPIAAAVAAVAVVVLVAILISRVPKPRADRWAPTLLDRAIDSMTTTLNKSRQRDIEALRPRTKPSVRPAPVPLPKPQPKQRSRSLPAPHVAPDTESVPEECVEQAKRLSTPGCHFEARVPGGSHDEAYCRDSLNTRCGEFWLSDRPGGRFLAKFDAIKGRDVFECKCGYEDVARDLESNDPRRRFVARERLYGEKGIIKQIQSHLRYVADCKLGTYRLIVSSDTLAQLIRDQVPSLKVEVVHDPSCE